MSRLGLMGPPARRRLPLPGGTATPPAGSGAGGANPLVLSMLDTTPPVGAGAGGANPSPPPTGVGMGNNLPLGTSLSTGGGMPGGGGGSWWDASSWSSPWGTSSPPAPSSVTAPTFSAFTGTAPTPTAYGTFTAPDLANFERSKDSLYLQDAAQKAMQRSGAAHGMLFSGGLLKALQADAIARAAQDYQNQFNRDLASYSTNRDTHAQNFGQQLSSYGAGLEGWKANTGANLDYGRAAMDAGFGNYDRNYRAYQDGLDRFGAFGGSPASDYADWAWRQRMGGGGSNVHIVTPGESTPQIGPRRLPQDTFRIRHGR